MTRFDTRIGSHTEATHDRSAVLQLCAGRVVRELGRCGAPLVWIQY